MTNQHCIHRAGCPKPDVCQEVGHCTSMTAADLVSNPIVRMGRLWEDGAYTELQGWVRATDYERLDADAAGAQAELASVKALLHALNNDKTALSLEIERLQQENAALKGEAFVLKTARERLRAALKRICTTGTLYQQMPVIAREALSGQTSAVELAGR